MIELPAFQAHREWLLVKVETPIFWRLIMDTACHRCDHSPVTPVDGHDGWGHNYISMFSHVVGIVGVDEVKYAPALAPSPAAVALPW